MLKIKVKEQLQAIRSYDNLKIIKGSTIEYDSEVNDFGCLIPLLDELLDYVSIEVNHETREQTLELHIKGAKNGKVVK